MLVTTNTLDKIEIVRGQFMNAVRVAKLVDPLAIALRQKVNKALDLTIDDALKIDANTPLPAVPVVVLPPESPAQQIIPGGVLTVSFGTITITSGLEIVWSNGVRTTGFVGCREAFAVNDIVYITDIEGSHFRYFGSNPDVSNNSTSSDYAAVRATALVIIIPAVDS